MSIPNKRIGDFEFRGTKALSRWEEDTLYYEIVKWYPNEYYGRESEFEYIEEENFYVPKDYQFFNHKISPGCFKHKECCYTVATFIYDDNEPDYDLKSVGSRIVDSCKTLREAEDLFKVMHYGFKELNKQIGNETD